MRPGRTRARLRAGCRSGAPWKPASEAAQAPQRLLTDRRATRDFHPSRRQSARRNRAPGRARTATTIALPQDTDQIDIRLGGRIVRLTNLGKLFWPELGLTK